MCEDKKLLKIFEVKGAVQTQNYTISVSMLRQKQKVKDCEHAG